MDMCMCVCGCRMAVRLAVAGAFHTEYMQPAVEKLREQLAATTIVTPRIPVISNVDAQPHSDPAVIRAILSRQVSECLSHCHSVAAAARAENHHDPLNE